MSRWVRPSLNQLSLRMALATLLQSVWGWRFIRRGAENIWRHMNLLRPSWRISSCPRVGGSDRRHLSRWSSLWGASWHWATWPRPGGDWLGGGAELPELPCLRNFPEQIFSADMPQPGSPSWFFFITLGRGLKIDCGCGLFVERQVGLGAIVEDFVTFRINRVALLDGKQGGPGN